MSYHKSWTFPVRLRIHKLPNWVLVTMVQNGVSKLLLTYLDTWSGFEAAKTAPWPSRGLHHFGKFLEPSDEWAGRGCYCFLMRWHGHFSLIRNELQKFVELKYLIFLVLTLSMSLRDFGNELYNRGPNTVIAFSWGIVLG